MRKIFKLFILITFAAFLIDCSESYEEHRNKGKELLKKGKYSEAAEEFERAIELNDNDFQTYIWLAICYSKLEKKNLALKNFKRALNIAPENPYTHYALAGFYWKEKDYKNAEKEFIKVIALRDKLTINPGTTNSYKKLSQIYDQQNKLAKKHLYEGIFLYRKGFYHSVSEEKKGYLLKAKSELERSLELDKDNIRTIHYLILTHFQLGDMETAKKMGKRIGSEDLEKHLDKEEIRTFKDVLKKISN